MNKTKGPRTLEQLQEAVDNYPSSHWSSVPMTREESILYSDYLNRKENTSMSTPRTLDELKKALVSAAPGEKVLITEEEQEVWDAYWSIDRAQNLQRQQQSSIAEVLAERGTRYGPFAGHAHITQALKQDMRNSPKWRELTDSQSEALEMIAHKIGRILNGDPNYLDSWVDIVGYTQLVIDELNAMPKELAK